MASSALQSYLKPSFVVCTALLLTAAAAKETIIRVLGVQMTKQRIELRHPLAEMNEQALRPYVVKQKEQILNRDVLESLGTEEYLQWILEDPEAPAGSPLRFCSLFITYYTGNPDMVPHVPDECYVGGGNERKDGQTLTLDIPLPQGERKLAFQYVIFGRAGTMAAKEDNFSVQYFFHANGRYCGDRTQTRLVLGSNWFSKYSYFCKVEWKFYGADAFGVVYPSQEQTLEASRRLLARLLPELEANHWPDWEAANAKPQQRQRQ
ncbi:MAG TPA: hypothetical protein PK052_06410 [Anaerohalosphaeraceae bacterium]|nr:hypothetical protein [Anaerohalosphaeraceae bacterium]HOL31600.1 hypothetical protein [Anaerohalosphaeraceae bacterium]HPC63474.1 hypothetical protein [Anaerohalosphaeraceae bacterium]HRS70467.1 hypothetical protein [Anaerohalosphaeraceae bacterium]HRV19742.1 hypothetical protein [Anaerohalosphaeraceae bacterium]